MKALRELSAAQLNKMIKDTQAELTRRKRVDAAANEISAILDKYKIDIKDIGLKQVTKGRIRNSAQNPAKVTKSRDRRRIVKAKYKDPNSQQTWTGRGRAPAWVQSLCLNEGIDISFFKKDNRFRY